VLSRSGCAGTAKYAAVWTGDNVSNEFYLQNSLPTSLGMSISGLPFNGPDIGGFGGDAGDELMVRWFQAGFLFPFFRNHTTADSRREEPWEYPAPVRRAVARSIRLRYRLLPYLYDLYAHHETDGDALLRPVLYDFPGEEAADLYDQFLVGPWVLQAPVLELGSTSRKVWLPGDGRWLCGRTGLWRAPGRHTVRTSLATTPLWLLEGAVVPMLDSEPRHNDVPLAQAVAFCAAGPGWKGATSFDHVADDGISYDYRNGGRSRLRIEAEGDGRRLLVRATQTEDGFGPMRKEVWLPRSADAEVVGMEKAAEATLRLTGRPLPVDVYREKS
jgi:alpha-glucosidase